MNSKDTELVLKRKMIRYDTNIFVLETCHGKFTDREKSRGDR